MSRARWTRRASVCNCSGQATTSVKRRVPRGEGRRFLSSTSTFAPQSPFQADWINLIIARTLRAALGTKELTATNSGNFEPSGLRSEQ